MALYQEVAEQIRGQIESGRLAPDANVGTLGQIQKRYDISQGTARAALRLLSDLGLVKTIPGKGTFVLASRTSGDGRMAAVEQRLDYLETLIMDTRAAAGLEQDGGHGEKAQAI